MVAHWSLVGVRTADGRASTCALRQDGSIVIIPGLEHTSGPLEVIREWEKFAPVLAEWDAGTARPAGDVELVAPLLYPPKVICVGSNYASHRKEMNNSLVSEPVARPFFFLKPPTTTVIGAGADILIRDVADCVDWEAEIGVVIGKGGHEISVGDAMSHVAGYTLVNDVSARGLHHRADAIADAYSYDWLTSKGQNTFCPIGPGIAPSWLIADPRNVEFRLLVNDVEKQSASTAQMITDMPGLIAAASRVMSLEPGDVIATGTPGGVGAGRQEFLGDGDVVEIISPVIGRLTNRVRLRERTRG